MDDPLKKSADDESFIPDMYETIADEVTGVGELLGKLPGLRGYMEKERRREADEILRNTLAARLDEERLKLGAVYQELSRDIIKAMEYAESLGRLDSRMAGLIGKIESAPSGYAGLFDAVKMKEDDLARLYDYDASMLTYVDTIGERVAALTEAVNGDGQVATAIRALDTILQEASTAFNARGELLSGIK
jgi:hypothetical protein